LVVAERDRRRWERGHLEIRTTSGPAAPPRDSPVLFGPNGLYVGGHAPVDRHPQAGVVAVNADNDRSMSAFKYSSSSEEVPFKLSSTPTFK
jgi:hypothetical protein